jgi:hypothetical protein
VLQCWSGSPNRPRARRVEATSLQHASKRPLDLALRRPPTQSVRPSVICAGTQIRFRFRFRFGLEIKGRHATGTLLVSSVRCSSMYRRRFGFRWFLQINQISISLFFFAPAQCGSGNPIRPRARWVETEALCRSKKPPGPNRQLCL